MYICDLSFSAHLSASSRTDAYNILFALISCLTFPLKFSVSISMLLSFCFFKIVEDGSRLTTAVSNCSGKRLSGNNDVVDGVFCEVKDSISPLTGVPLAWEKLLKDCRLSKSQTIHFPSSLELTNNVPSLDSSNPVTAILCPENVVGNSGLCESISVEYKSRS